ncbi:lipopolysaccharide biosynthesis protein [Elioraea sp. Yellowstone]|uniref:lipopolysaccharide biosynthesis protein n=1 Tax=Elioraea sp. Yellowstone TaxID=2592070 RepID=UPI001386D6E3|nr:lipopolysaccharide biosynthesis protein [Elioraea sp. Yellowstone]
MTAEPAPTPPPDPTLGRRAAVASTYAVLQRIAVRSIGLVSTLVLVRLLTPQDFGVVGIASVVQTMLDWLTSTGFGLALIRMPAVERRHYDTAFTLTVARGVLIAGLLVAAAEPYAAFMDEPRVAPVMWFLAATAVVQSLDNIRLFDLQRSLRFDVLLRYHVLGKVLGFAAVLPLAFWLRSYWALVIAPSLARLILLPIGYWIVPYRPRLGLGAWRELFHFSKWIFLGNVVAVADAQSFNVIVGRLNGVAAVGVYQVAYQVGALPISELAAPIRQPAFAAFARVQHDRRALTDYLLAGLALQWLLIMPLSAGIALTAREITLLFLGDRWSMVIGLLPLVALFALFDGLRDYLGSLFLALNRQRIVVVRLAALTVLKVLAVFWAAGRFGLQGAAVAMLAAAVVTFLLWLAMTRRQLACAWRQIVAALWRPAAGAAAMAATVLVLPDGIGPLLGGPAAALATALALKAVLGALAYAVPVVTLWLIAGAPGRSAEAFVLRGLQAALRRVVRLRQ